MPAYNAQDDIRASIASVQNQTWTGDLEILVCDDGSTDGTVDVVQDMARTDPRIRMISNGRNLGRPATRNHLAREARGGLLTWLDADDEKYPDMLRNQMETFLLQRERRQSEKFIVVTNYDWQFEERNEDKLIKVDPGRDSVKSLLDGSFGAYLWLTLARKSVIQAALPFDESLPRLQDLDFFLRCAGRGIDFVPIRNGRAQCVYRKTDIGRNAQDVERCFAHIRKKHSYLIDLYGREYRRELVLKHLYVAQRFAAANNDDTLAAQYARRRSLIRLGLSRAN
ncbi:glycosyltransferase family 2 protein [Falsirhodobacter sp. alg1]|uniref:glycosyltransferase family 2 protein n=1 Tax=Falsirhodobacter sp. alg1 TaxID=1472418 RepID=UPI0006939899|nr:glycosyltransferase family 2 protein [Falsirhodobacter sp. alg1]